jgi:predicted ester cyclase
MGYDGGDGKGREGPEAQRDRMRSQRREQMSTESNKALVRHLVDEVQNRGNIAAMDEIAAPTFVNHSAPPGMSSDREGVKQITLLFRQAFPDGVMTVEDMLAEGDLVATHKTFRGTHQGPFMGLAPTAKQVEIGLIDIVRVVDGRVTEHWNAVDNLGLLQQLGVFPPLGQAPG